MQTNKLEKKLGIQLVILSFQLQKNQLIELYKAANGEENIKINIYK